MAETDTYRELARRLGITPIRFSGGRPYLRMNNVEHGGYDELCHAIIRDRAAEALRERGYAIQERKECPFPSASVVSTFLLHQPHDRLPWVLRGKDGEKARDYPAALRAAMVAAEIADLAGIGGSDAN